MNCLDCGTDGDAYVLAEDSGDFGGNNNDDQYVSWNSRKLAEYVEKAGLKSYASMIITHKITGKVAPLLTDANLKEMGMTVVGDRLRFKQLMVSLGRKARCSPNDKPLWQLEEQKYFTSFEKDLCTCYGFLPADPSTYRLTNNTLKIKRVKSRWGRYDYSLKNIELALIKDADVTTIAAPCPQKVFCCATGTDIVEIRPTESQYNSVVLKVGAGEGSQLCKMILMQVEKNQIMDRD